MGKWGWNCFISSIEFSQKSNVCQNKWKMPHDIHDGISRASLKFSPTISSRWHKSHNLMWSFSPRHIFMYGQIKQRVSLLFTVEFVWYQTQWSKSEKAQRFILHTQLWWKVALGFVLSFLFLFASQRLRWKPAHLPAHALQFQLSQAHRRGWLGPSVDGRLAFRWTGWFTPGQHCPYDSWLCVRFQLETKSVYPKLTVVPAIFRSGRGDQQQ